MRLHEMREKAPRAGIYPVFIKEDNVWVFMMIPSDRAYGGTDPQMGKGRVDEGETVEIAAMREGQEELGLRKSNVSKMELLVKERITGADGHYDISVFAAIVIDPKAFNAPGKESGWAGWLPMDKALAKGRANQRHFVQAIKDKYI